MTYPREVGPEADQDGRSHSLTFPQQSQEHVLCPDVAVIHLQRLAQREFQDLLGPRREGRGAARDGPGRPDRLLDLVADGVEGDPERPQGLGADSIPLANQPEQNVLGADERVIELDRFFLRQREDPPCPVGKTFEHIFKATSWPRQMEGSLPRSSG